MPDAPLLLAIDQGTTNTKALLLDTTGAIRARAARPVSISFPQPGWVEQDPLELWTSAHQAAADCLAQCPGAPIAAIGLSNQRESILLWDRRTGRPAGPCITWQCRRTTAFCEELRRQGLESNLRERSGLPLDPLFSASKLRWLLHHAAAPPETLCAGTVDAWLLWNLTGGAAFATDLSNAARTQLLNLEACAWDPDLLRIFSIPAACLPKVAPSSSLFGTTAPGGPLPAGIPIAAMIGDSHAALVGHAAFTPGAVKATYGTGSSLMAPLDRPIASRHGLSTTVAWADPARVRYALEGNITNTGGTVQWLTGILGLPGSDALADLAATVPDSAGAYLVPAFAGLGAPHWDSDARGLLCGLTRGATAAHLARAAIDSIAFQIHDVFESMRLDAGCPLPALFADGGASRNPQLMQFQADLLGVPVIRSASPELSALGAACLAGLAVGLWNSTADLERLPRATTTFEPQMPTTRRDALLDGWHDALHRARSRPAV